MALDFDLGLSAMQQPRIGYVPGGHGCKGVNVALILVRWGHQRNVL